jgi:peptidoglycan/xylan/chitin deacetylase (PgdA/CDA1 family)
MQFAPLYPLLYRILHPTFPGCLWNGAVGEGRQIALTFDDGPHPEHTPALLQVLDHYQIPASFFWLGLCVERSPTIARAIYDRGHWLALHSYDHRNFPRLSAPDLYQSLERTQQAIAQACGLDLHYVQSHIRDVRPPNGFFTPRTLTQLQQAGYRTVMWSVVPEDWVQPGIERVAQRVMHQVRPGSIIVLHDGYSGGADVAAITAKIVPQLLNQGYEFVTIDQFWRLHAQFKAPSDSAIGF